MYKKQANKKKLVDLIQSRLRDLKDKIKRMPQNKIEIEKPDIMVNIVEKILKFNRQNKKDED